METVYIRGGAPLCGRVPIDGAKNAALPILFATLLCDGACTIDHLPDIADVREARHILENMGAITEQTGENRWTIDTRAADAPADPDPLCGRLRASSYLLGACAARFGRGCVGRAGGCDLGARPIDRHRMALEALGATVEETEERVTVSAGHLHGAVIRFAEVSVGATVNAILAAVRAKGETILYGAAREPHVTALCDFLVRAGGDIRRETDGTIRIRGVRRLHGTCYTIPPDMIEAGTYLLAGVATHGAVTVQGIDPDPLRPLLSPLRRMGVDVDADRDAVSVFAPGKIGGCDVTTGPFPDFPTDLQPQFSAVLAVSDNAGTVRDTVFPDRFRYAAELAKMGARVSRAGDTMRIRGTRLHGAAVTVPDLRGGAALLIAACAAEGESALCGAPLLLRGYARFVEKYRALGADIRTD